MKISFGLFFVSLAFGQPAPQYVGTRFDDFSGGVNDNSRYLEKNESPDALNVTIDDPPRTVRTRNGISLCGTLPSGNSPTFLFNYSKSDGSQRLIATDNGTYYDTGDCVTWTTITSGQDTTAIPTMAVVRNKLWIANKSTHTSTWDGATFTLNDGRSGTPNPAPPKCAYLQFWKERVWCGRSSSNQSGIAFSALATTGGDLIDPSTGTLSWPAANLIQIDRDGGCPLYGIKAYKDALYAFKGECGVFKLLFENEFNNQVVKLPAVGTRFHHSIAEGDDGILYYTGPDGQYAFDGQESVRISDKINNKFLSLRQPNVSSKFKAWSLQSEWDDGTVSSITFATTPGDIQISTRAALIQDGDFQAGNLTLSWSTSAPTGSSATLSGSFHAVVRVAIGGTGVCQETVRILDQNFTELSNLGSSTCGSAAELNRVLQIGSFIGQTVRVRFYAYSPALAKEATIVSSTFTVVGSSLSFDCQAQTSAGDCGWDKIDNVKNANYFSSGVWTSDKFNAVTISTWGAFEATHDTNGGTVLYEIRLGTNSGAVDNATYSTILPGALIPGSTSLIVAQVRSTLGSSSNDANTPNVHDITLNYSQGDVTNSTIYGFFWKGRYYVSGATGTSTTNNWVGVKGKYNPVAWTFNDWRGNGMVRWNDKFYIGASTWSAVYRADLGTNDNGASINSYWTTRDDDFGLPSNPKTLMEILVDRDNDSSINNFRIASSRNNGISFTERTVSLAGTGIGASRIYINGGNSRLFRARVADSALDEAWRVHALEMYAIPYNIRGN